MTVTAIERGKKNDRRYNVFIDGEFSFAVYDDTILEFHLKKGTMLSLSEIDEITQFDRKKMAFEKAMTLLSRKDYSRKGLIRKLKEKGIPEENAEAAAEQMQEAGYIDDSNFAREMAEYYCNIKGFGKRRIVCELISRGIDKETAAEAADGCAGYEEGIDMELEKALKNKDVSDPKEKRRAFERLVRKGYDYDSIKEAMERRSGEENW